MNINMIYKLASILLIVLGVYFIVKHRKFAREIVDYQRNKILPFKKATAKEHSIIYLVGGIILSLVGILTLFGVIHFNQ